MSMNSDVQVTITSPHEIVDVEAHTELDRWHQLKTEGKLRFLRIKEILGEAFSATQSEIKAGSDVVLPIAQELATDTAEKVKDVGNAATVDIRETWNNNPDRAVALKSIFLSLAQLLKGRLTAWYRSEAKVIDQALTKSVGDRTLK